MNKTELIDSIAAVADVQQRRSHVGLAVEEVAGETDGGLVLGATIEFVARVDVPRVGS